MKNLSEKLKANCPKLAGINGIPYFNISLNLTKLNDNLNLGKVIIDKNEQFKNLIITLL